MDSGIDERGGQRPNNDELAQVAQPSGASQASACSGIECCPTAFEPVDLSAMDDVYVDAIDGVCVRTLDGDDAIHDEGERTLVIAGDGDDVVTALAAFAVIGGEGNDEIESAAQGAQGGEIDGGDGDDTIIVTSGHHIVTPGPGRDSVQAGPGPVVVQILDACELEAGESYSASGDDDLIVLPFGLAQAVGLGIAIEGFERVAVTGATCLSTCAPADCVQGEGAA